MKWDEERYGLEYDLDIYNIVAVNDFNMGACLPLSLYIYLPLWRQLLTSRSSPSPYPGYNDDQVRLASHCSGPLFCFRRGHGE